MTRSPFRGHLDPQRPAAPWEQGNFWGQYPDETELPNVAGAKIQLDSVQRGDIAWSVDTNALFVCVDETVGAAVWHQIFVNGPAIEDHQTAKIIVGNFTNGDTELVCDILDPGDGSGIRQALAQANAGDDVYVRPGLYDLADDNVNPGPIVVPDEVTLRGPPFGRDRILSGASESRIQGRPGANVMGDTESRQILSCGKGVSVLNLTLRVPAPNIVAPLPTGDRVVDVLDQGTIENVVIQFDSDNGQPDQIAVDTLRTAFLNLDALTTYRNCAAANAPNRQRANPANEPFVGYRGVEQSGFVPNVFYLTDCRGGGDVAIKLEGVPPFQGGAAIIERHKCEVIIERTFINLLDESPWGFVMRDCSFLAPPRFSVPTSSHVDIVADGFFKIINPVINGCEFGSSGIARDFGIRVRALNGGSIRQPAIRSCGIGGVDTGVEITPDVSKGLVALNAFLATVNTALSDNGDGTEVAHNTEG